MAPKRTNTSPMSERASELTCTCTGYSSKPCICCQLKQTFFVPTGKDRKSPKNPLFTGKIV